jgi:hypothetical protein
LSSNNTVPNVAAPSPSDLSSTFHKDKQAFRVNLYWFLSLVLALLCAFTATLVKQWGRNYLHEVARHPAAYRRARVRAFLFEGLEHFGLPAIVNAVPTLLHGSLFIFLMGLVEFLLPIDRALGHFFLGILVAASLLYGYTIVLPPVFLIWA